MIFRDLRFQGFWLINWPRDAPRREIESTYGRLAELVADGTPSTRVADVYPLDAYRHAFARAKEGKRNGKVLFRFA